VIVIEVVAAVVKIISVSIVHIVGIINAVSRCIGTNMVGTDGPVVTLVAQS
jgi:hypothetical protein